jgi:Holliday junction resolvase RusA-like endonuclease
MNTPCGKCRYDPTLRVINTYTVKLPISAVSQNRLSGRTAATTRRMYSALRNRFEKLMVPLVGSIPSARGKRRVTFTRVYKKGKRPYDDDNLTAGFKGARDVLTRLGLLVDDTAKFLEAHYSQRPGEEDGVEVVLEDLEWG